MNGEFPTPVKTSATPYIVALVMVLLIGAAFLLGILYLRPQTDPLTLLSAIGGLAVLVGGQAMVFLKAHETGVKTDGVMHEWQLARDAANLAEGKNEGAAKEQARVAEQKAVAIASATQAAPAEIIVEAKPK